MFFLLVFSINNPILRMRQSVYIKQPYKKQEGDLRYFHAFALL